MMAPVHKISDASNLDMLDKEMTDVSGEQSETKQGFIRLLKTSLNFKLMNCLFLEFSF